jgi:hypothetical protein
MDDRKPIAIIALAIIVLLGGGAWWMSRSTAPAPANETPRAVAATDAPIDKPAPPPPDLPPLDRMDGYLRPLLAALSSRPELARWLATDDLVGQLAMALDQASTGASPARDFKVLAPSSAFVAAGRGDRRVIDIKSYRRYDSLVATVTSIDAANVATIYRTIRPRLNEAYQRLGNQGRHVDQAVQLTLDILLDTPVNRDPIAVRIGEGAGWTYVDDELEALTPTQKQLLRMGPANVERLQVWLRALQAALA